MNNFLKPRSSSDKSLQKTFVSAEDASDSEDEGSEPVTNPDPNQTNPVPKETPEETLMLPCIYCGNDYKVTFIGFHCFCFHCQDFS